MSGWEAGTEWKWFLRPSPECRMLVFVHMMHCFSRMRTVNGAAKSRVLKQGACRFLTRASSLPGTVGGVLIWERKPLSRDDATSSSALTARGAGAATGGAGRHAW